MVAMRRADGNSLDGAFEFNNPVLHFWAIAFSLDDGVL